MRFSQALVWGAGGIAGAAVLAAVGGCVAEAGPGKPARMPTALAPIPAPPPDVSESRVFTAALEAAGREDGAAVTAALQSLPAAERGAVARALGTAVARQDLDRADRVVQAMPAGVLQAQAVEAVGRVRAERDPGGAVAWALAWPQPATALAARQAVAEQRAEHDPRGTVQEVLALPVSPERNAMLGIAVAAWGRRDPSAAMGWVRDFEAGEVKTLVATSLGFALAQTEPQRAVEVAEWVPAGRDRWLVVGAIGQTWVASNPTEAWRWAGQLPAGEAREAALAGIETGLGGARSRRPAGGVANAGLRVGGGGLGGPADPGLLPAGPERDRALRKRFEETLRESPARAASWLASLPLPDRKDDMVDDLARQWLRTDPRAARTWMEQTILSPGHREQLLREAGR